MEADSVAGHGPEDVRAVPRSDRADEDLLCALPAAGADDADGAAAFHARGAEMLVTLHAAVAVQVPGPTSVRAGSHSHARVGASVTVAAVRPFEGGMSGERERRVRRAAQLQRQSTGERRGGVTVAVFVEVIVKSCACAARTVTVGGAGLTVGKPATARSISAAAVDAIARNGGARIGLAKKRRAHAECRGLVARRARGVACGVAADAVDAFPARAVPRLAAFPAVRAPARARCVAGAALAARRACSHDVRGDPSPTPVARAGVAVVLGVGVVRRRIGLPRSAGEDLAVARHLPGRQGRHAVERDIDAGACGARVRGAWIVIVAVGRLRLGRARRGLSVPASAGVIGPDPVIPVAAGARAAGALEAAGPGRTARQRDDEAQRHRCRLHAARAAERKC